MQRRGFTGRFRQQGMSMWAWLFFLAMMALILTSALRLGPHYLDYRIVQGVADRLPVDEVHAQWSRAQINDHFKKQFRVENFTIPIKDMMKVDRSRDETVIAINYEVREHLFYNVDVVLVFSDRRTFD
jgi:hypothetical protein